MIWNKLQQENHHDSHSLLSSSSSSAGETSPNSILPQYNDGDSRSSTPPSNDNDNGNGSNENLSTYEKLRARNIERNNKRMVELGLMSEEEANITNQRAWKKIDENCHTTTDRNRSSQNENRSRKTNAFLGIGMKRRRLKKCIGDNNDNNLKKNVPNVTYNRSTRGLVRKGHTIGVPRTRKQRKELIDLESSHPSIRTSARKRAKQPFVVKGIWV